MTRGGIFFTGLGLLVLAGIVFWKVEYPTIHIRYRLTVEVQVGDQIKTGSSVIDVAFPIGSDSLRLPDAGLEEPRVAQGFAVTINLDDSGLLFLTFEENSMPRHKILCPFQDIGCMPFAAYDISAANGSGYGGREAALRVLQSQSGPVDVPFSSLTEFVRFRDINDRRSVEPVSPFGFATAFSSDIALKRVVLELTNDPVAPTPNEWPRWLLERDTHEDIHLYFKGRENR